MSKSGPAAPPEGPDRAASGAALRLASAEVELLLRPYFSDRSSDGRVSGVVLAVSGGPDSVALMRLAAALRSDASPLAVVATVDHGLRAGSRSEAEEVAAWAKSLDLPHRVLTWEGDKPRTRVQEIARRERYRLLVALAREVGASHVLTGHTLDDQAETVVMRLIRGTGIGGLAGMRRDTALEGVTLSRPFLDLSKARLVATCQAEGWPYVEDPSNTDPRFTRARLRRGLMPALAREGLTAERVAALARRAARAEDALSARAAQVLAENRLAESDGGLELDGRTLAAEPEAIFLRVVALAIVEVTGAQTRPVRLAQWETRVLGDLRGAIEAGRALRMTLGGALVEVVPDRRVVLRRERPRRRNVSGPGKP